MLHHFYGAHVDRIPFRSSTAAVKGFTEQRIRLQREQTRLFRAQGSNRAKHRSVDGGPSRSETNTKTGGDGGVTKQPNGNATYEEDAKYKEMYEARILSPLILADLRVRPPLSVVNVNAFHVSNRFAE
jgi:hypothetical protein